jgi:hypothetical protein
MTGFSYPLGFACALSAVGVVPSWRTIGALGPVGEPPAQAARAERRRAAGRRAVRVVGRSMGSP